jgi:phage-related minor tail protein
MEKANAEAKKQEAIIRQVDVAYEEFNGNLENYAKAITTHPDKIALITEFTKRLNKVREDEEKKIENIANLQERKNELEQLQLTQTGKQLELTNQELKQIDDKIKKLKELGIEQEKLVNREFTKTPEGILDFFTEIENANEKKVKTRGQQFIEGSGVEDQEARTERVFASANERIQQQIDKINEARKGMQGFGEDTEKSSETLEILGDIASSAFNVIAEALIGLALGVKTSFKDVVTSILLAAQRIILSNLAVAISEAIKGSYQTSGGNPIAGLIIAAGAVAALTAFWNSAIPSFQSGGNFHPSFAGNSFIAGETGVELVTIGNSTPAHIYNHRDTEALLSGGGSGGVLSLNVRGDEVQFVLDEAKRRRRR